MSERPPTQGGDASTRNYFAFISYSHRDKLWADWLHKSLETYRVPSRLVGQTTDAGSVPKRLTPIFRDRDELASATDLGRTVNAALAQSANLIVICSPHAAASHWVNEEVLAFKRLGRGERIFCLVVSGEPNATDMPGRADDECLAPALRFTIDAQGQPTSQHTEPVAADARPGRDGKQNAKLKLIAGLLHIGFDTLKRRELQRRNRRLVIVATAALIVMTVTSLLAIAALISRNAAERRQKQAEDLVGFMLGDLNDKLTQLSRLDIMETVDDKAMDYFQALPVSDVTDSALVQRAKALEKIGIVRQEQGHLPAAMASFKAAAKLAGSLADAMPHDVPRQIAYSRELAFVGMTDWRQDKLDAAQESFEAAQRALQRAESQASADSDLLYQSSVIDNNIGHVLEARGKIDEAEAQYRSMLARCRQLTAGTNGKTKWTSQLGSAHNNLGQVAMARGDLATAVAEYAADDAIETALSDLDPKNNDQRENKMRVRAILGRTIALTGDIDAGMKDLREAVDISEQLLKVDPNHSEFQEYAALYSSQLARLHRLAGDLPTGNAISARALGIFSELTRQDPDNTVWQQEFAEAQTERAAQLLAAGQRDAARAPVRSALNILDPLLARRPDSRGVLIATAHARLLSAAASDDPADAEQLRRSVLDASHAGRGTGSDPRLLAQEATALIELKRVDEAKPLLQRLWTSGYRDRSLTALLQREHIDFPVNADFQQRLQVALGRNDGR
jgi:tetratricopeptide (TPR) repeat protein